MNKEFKVKLVFAFIGLLPLIVLVIGYVLNDPFMVIRDYQDYSNSRVILDRDYVSTQMLIKNINLLKYNSFIFGNSRTVAFQPKEWGKYLTEEDHPFLFDASGDTVYGIYLKFRFLESMNIPIDNAIIVLCRDSSFGQFQNSKNHLSIKHPATSRESWFAFHMVFFRAYMNPRFLVCYYTYRSTHSYKPWMKNYLDDREIRYDRITNQVELPDAERQIKSDSSAYYNAKSKIFYPRGLAVQDTVRRITPKDEEMLSYISGVLRKKKSDFRVVLSPLYEQIRFSVADLRLLQTLFPDRVWDFSGKNEFTESKINYYETSHYRPIVGKQIFEKIYHQPRVIANIENTDFVDSNAKER